MRIFLKKRGDGAWAQGVELALVDMFGQRSPYKVPPVIKQILKWLLRGGSSDTAIARLAGVSRQHVSKFREDWGDDIRRLRLDAKFLGYDAEALAMFLEFGGGDAFIGQLKELYTRRGEEPAALLPAQYQHSIDALWREYREAKSYQGFTQDDFEVKPPRWFVRDELGLSPLDEMMLVRGLTYAVC